MSFLTPLYVAGLLTVALPLIFHLIRRTPRGQREFSSLMFLAASPPRLSRRSRLDNLLLLALRALALILLALAFARPLLREAVHFAVDGQGSRQVAILLDTSASMQRGDLWSQAVAEVRQVLGQLDPADDVALITFDRQPAALADFTEQSGIRPPDKMATLQRRLNRLRPTWNHTDLGSALVAAADALELAGSRQRTQPLRQVVLVSDMQRGAEIDALQAYPWPEDVKLAIHQVTAHQPTNASLTLLADRQDESPDQLPRVRVTNAADSTTSQFQVRWAASGEEPGQDSAMAVHVPPGHSRVLRMRQPGARALRSGWC